MEKPHLGTNGSYRLGFLGLFNVQEQTLVSRS